MRYYVIATRGPKGRQTGYAVKDSVTDLEVPGTRFTNRGEGFWRFAKTQASARAIELNAKVHGVRMVQELTPRP